MKVLQLFLMLRKVGLTGSRRVLRDRPPKLEAEQIHEQQQGHLQTIFNYVGHLPLVHGQR